LNKEFNVLSLFDGISSGRMALERAGINIKRYYASEIDKNAIKIAQKNYSNTIQLGDVKEWRNWELPKIDLLIGGSPCQGFSFAGKQLNFNDQRSKLFFEFVDILNHYKPKYFLLENVKMKKEYQDIISGYLGVKPIEINSSLLSAQNRKRLYWTNIPNVIQPEDRGILLKDIVHEKFDELLFDIEPFNVHPSGRGMNGRVKSVGSHKSDTLTTNKGEGQKIAIPLSEYIVPFDKTLQILDKEVARGKVGYFRQDSQANRVYYIHNKAVALCGEAGGGAGGGAAKMGQYLFGCITPDRVNKRQNGQRFSEGKKFYTLTAQDKHGILIEGYIRKLTPIECERLQTLPDDYTYGVSNTQRYKMLGNGWTVDVIAHIFSFLNINEVEEHVINTKEETEAVSKKVCESCWKLIDGYSFELDNKTMCSECYDYHGGFNGTNQN